MSLILGTNGNDTKDGTNLADTLYGFDGDDQLSGKDGSDMFVGGTGNDTLRGGGGDDLFYGSTVIGSGGSGVYDQNSDGQGDDTFYGDSGFDTVSYRNTGRVTAHLGNGTASNSSIGHDKLVGIDHVIGSNDVIYGDLLIGREDDWLGYQGDDQLDGLAGPDSLYGPGGDDVLNGGTGNDALNGEGDEDRLDGGDGDDLLIGGAGDDAFTGGSGLDTVSYLSADFVAMYTDGSMKGNEGTDTFAGIEKLVGSHNDDLLSAGFPGLSSTLRTIEGREGSDYISGSSGNDTLLGGADGDELRGRLGVDDLWGGAGYDEFWFGTGDTGVGAGNRDVIHDFQHGLDVIDLGSIDGGQSTPGSNQAFTFVGTAAFTAEAQLRQTSESGNTIIQGNTDIDGAPEFEIQLSGLHTMSSSDFGSLFDIGDYHFGW